MRFNSISKINSREPCDKSSQIDLKSRQCQREYWTDNPSAKYLAFCGKEHCCTIDTVTVTKQSSSVTVNRSFPVTFVFSEADLGLSVSSSKMYMGPEFVQLFNSKVIMAQQVLNFMKDMRDKVMTSITTNTIDIAQSLLSIINDVEETTRNTSMKVDKEIQFNEWLFAKLDSLLSPQGFTVRRSKLNKDIMLMCWSTHNASQTV